MATGLGRSQVGASDVIYDFACTPCAEDAKNTEAVYHCAGCQMYYCARCVEFHRKLFKSHTESEISDLKYGRRTTQHRSTVAKKAEFQTDMCYTHPAEAIKMFCRNHDVVCCTVCIALFHRSCKGVEYIPNIAGNLLKRHEMRETKLALEKVKQDLQTLKITREADILKLDTEEETAIKEMENTKQRIFARVDEMGKTSRTDIRDEHDMISAEIKDSIGSIENSLKIVDEELHRISQSTADKAACFVRVKQGQKKVLEGSNCYEQVKNKAVKSISYEMYAYLETVLYQSASLGYVVEDTGSPIKAKFLKEYDLRISSDHSAPFLYDICLLDNNQLIVSDKRNDILKRLDENFKVIDYIHLSGGPRSICTVGRFKLAVTLCTDKKVAFVSISSTMSSEATFDVGEFCRGICFCQDKLYVCCGGHPQFNERPGHINVYSMSGSLLRSFELTAEGNNVTPFPVGITTSFDHSKLFIADASQGFISLHAESGRQLSFFTNKKCLYTIGVCEDNRGHVFVCNGDSNNVVEIDKRGHFVQEILTLEDGIVDPLWVSFLQNPKRILVTCRNSSKLKVFYLV